MRSACPLLRRSTRGERGRAVWVTGGLLWLAAAGGMIGTGCRTEQSALQTEATSEGGPDKKKEQPPDFEIGRFDTLPSDDAIARSFVKPGHAVTASMPAIAHRADLRAELETQVTYIDRQPVPVGGTQFHLITSRPAVLAKGQRRYLESMFFVPHEGAADGSSMFLHRRLRDVQAGHVVFEDYEGTQSMPAYQYLLVVLAANANTYGYLKKIPSVYPTIDEILDDEGAVLHYRVVLPAVDDRVPLPAHAFSWTMTAYVLWDGVLADAMTPDQQRAMLDWLHWGGQLIISGPASLDHLAGSLLGPYLPATTDGSSSLDAEAFEQLNAYWSLQPAADDPRVPREVAPSRPLVGVRLRRHADAAWLTGCGELVAERRVGRGRIVVTAFGLNSPDLVNWGSWDSFVNNALLRRPRRVFTTNRFGQPQTGWEAFAWRKQDPLLMTATRYFTRDVGTAAGSPPDRRRPDRPVFRPPGGQSSNDAVWLDPRGVDLEADWHIDGCESDPVSGIGGWRDWGGVAAAAHGTLREAAGISIPRASFVLSVLVAYLVILVPVNWGFFRLCGRVEWAWAAAPLIALVGAGAVIRLAQLDIGFVRSRTEVAVLEMHAGHTTAHVTRYVALYSSLSTSYRLDFDDPAIIARPFPPTPSPDRLRPMMSRRDQALRLTGFQVDSNSTGFLHTEQLWDAGGALQLTGEGPDRWQVRNSTALHLHNVQLRYRTPDGLLLTCRLATLPADGTARVEFMPTDEAGEAATSEPWEGIDLREMTELALGGFVLWPGDVRLVAWIQDALPGLAITPAASQSRARALLLAHLRYGPLPPPRPDVNLLVDVRPPTEDDGTSAGELEVLSPATDGSDRNRDD